MLTNTEVSRVFDTVLSIPGMNEMVKMDMRLSRKNILLLHTVIARGLAAGEARQADYLLEGMPAGSLQELESFADECLSRAGLTDLSAKLKAFCDT